MTPTKKQFEEEVEMIIKQAELFSKEVLKEPIRSIFKKILIAVKIKARKEDTDLINEEYDKILKEDFSSEQLLSIAHFVLRIKEKLGEKNGNGERR